MVDLALKSVELTLTGKTLLDHPRLGDDRSTHEVTWFTVAPCEQDLASWVFPVLSLSILDQAQSLAKPAALADLLSSSITRTSSITILRRPFGFCAEHQQCTLLRGLILSLCAAPAVSFVWRLASPSIAARCFVHVRPDFTSGYISKSCRIYHRLWKHYKKGHLTCTWKTCFPVVKNIWRVCHWLIMQKLCHASAG